MSLLLDALKKAALEKQRREQTNNANSSASVAPASPPNEPDKNKSKMADTKSIATDTNGPIAAHKIELDQPKIDQVDNGLLDVPVVTLDSAPDEQRLNDESDNLVFDINDIDQAFLEPAEDEPLKKLPETEIVEEFVRKAHTQEASAGSPLSMMPDEVVNIVDNKSIETQVATSDLVQRSDVQKKAPPSETPEAPLNAETANPLYAEETTAPAITAVETVEVFNTSSGKAALAQLLERSKKAANSARRRMMLMYAFLSVTAVVLVVFYYYLLHSDSPMVVTLPPAAPANTVTPAAPEVAPVAKTPAEQVPVTDEADIATGSLVADTENTSRQIKQAVPRTLSEPKPESSNQPQPAARKFKPAQDVDTSYSLPPEKLPKQAMIVEHKAAVDAVSEAIDRGYKAYQRGDITAAGEAYREALVQEPYQRDALLGAAAVAVRQGRQQDALKFYQQRLARDPKDEYAQSGILALSENVGENPELDSELTRLLLEYPDAGHLHFLKGSLYAARKQWAAAQVSFFEAWQRDNKNPDVAFNLAVALDHLAQPKEAARFYHQALTLGNARPVSFSIDAIQHRLQDLEGAAP